jgi:BirA family biotin operon repressor/biotin-[acetyl-CoA-carboxylase] ligase
VESTQDLAKQMALSGEPEGTAIMALSQTRGRGRLGRTWISPPGANVALSLILRPHLAPTEAALLGLMASIAVAEAVEAAGIVRASLRWPNDVLVDGKKIAGILPEAVLDSMAIHFVILGIGLNVNSRSSDFPEDLATPATSLLMCIGRESKIEHVARSLLERMDSLYERAKREGCGFVPPLWEQRWENRRMRLVHEGAAGIAIGIDTDGALLLRLEDGRVRRVTSGEVTTSEAYQISPRSGSGSQREQSCK